MKAWFTALIRGRALELAVALSLGYAVVTLADAVVEIPVNVLAQHVSDEADFAPLPYGSYYPNFRVGSTEINYGLVLKSLLVLGSVTGVAWLVIRLRDRALGECPFCASRIPHDSTHCAYCGSGLVPDPR